MGKKRTGLQSDISSIFSGVPVPKKGSPPPESPAPPAKAADPKPPASPAKPSSVEPKWPASTPAAPKPAPVQIPAPAQKPKVAEPPAVVLPVKAPAVPPAPKVTEIKTPEPGIRQIPARVPQRRKDKFPVRKSSVSTGRQKASVVMFVVLSIALVLLLARPYYNSRGNPGGTDTFGQTSVGGMQVTNIEIEWQDPPVYPSYIRDPMDLESKGPVIENNDTLVVRGIVYSEDDPAALIDQKLYRVGDKVRGATIVDIQRDSVTFEKDGNTWKQEVQREER